MVSVSVVGLEEGFFISGGGDSEKDECVVVSLKKDISWIACPATKEKRKETCDITVSEKI